MYAFAKDGEVLFLCTLCMQFSLLSSIAILAIYRFDAMFDTKSALPDLSQNFETFILQNCKNTQAKPKLSKGILTLFW